MLPCWLNVCIVARHATSRKLLLIKVSMQMGLLQHSRYEPSLSDSYDDSSIRDLQSDVINGNRNRSSTISQKPFASSKLPVVQCVDEDQSLAKKAKRIRDSWSFRSTYAHNVVLIR